MLWSHVYNNSVWLLSSPDSLCPAYVFLQYPNDLAEASPDFSRCMCTRPPQWVEDNRHFPLRGRPLDLSWEKLQHITQRSSFFLEVRPPLDSQFGVIDGLWWPVNFFRRQPSAHTPSLVHQAHSTATDICGWLKRLRLLETHCKILLVQLKLYDDMNLWSYICCYYSQFSKF